MDRALPFLGRSRDQAGLQERFEEIYRETAGLVRSAVYLLGGADDLDDIVQDCYVKVWNNLERFEGRSSIRTWVYRIAVNAARDHWRRRGRQREVPLAALPERGGPPAPAVDVETRELVRTCLLALPLEQREAVTLHYYEGLPLEEIAQVCDIPLGTVKSRLFHGRKSLQGLLAPYGFKEERDGRHA